MAGEDVSPSSAKSQPAGGAACLLGKLKASPAKTALLCGLTLVLVVLIIRAAVKPNSASAKVVELAVPQKPTVIFRSPATPAPELSVDSVASDDSDSANDPKNVQNTMPRGDIFAINLRYFTPLSSEQPESGAPAGPTDPKKRRLIALQRRIREFQLQSTMTGPKPAAYIDGILLREGHTHKGFRITKINNRSVLLEQDGHVFDLHMPQR